MTLFNKVFISYAREDEQHAKEMFATLQEHDFDPWLDVEKIRPGALWDFEIKQNLKNSDFIIILLSEASVKKRGYVQREYKLALEIAEEIPEGNIFIIPILLTDCIVPSSLEKYHWVKYNYDVTQKVIDSIKYQREKYISELPEESVGLYNYETISIPFGKVLEKSVTDFTCSSIRFKENRFFDHDFVNSFLQQKVYEIISRQRNYIIDCFGEKSNWHNDIFIDINANIVTLTPDLLSLIIVDNNFLLTAHPNTYFHSLNILFKPERLATLNDIFEIDDLSSLLRKAVLEDTDIQDKEPILDVLQYVTNENIDYNIRSNQLEIMLSNFLPRIYLSESIVTIPLEKMVTKLPLHFK